MPHPHNGAFVAAYIQQEAEVLKRGSEDWLKRLVRSQLARELQIDPERIPDDAIRPFKRIRRLVHEDEGFSRANDVIGTLMEQNAQGQKPSPYDVELIVKKVFKKNESNLADAHQCRLQSSFIRAVCRPLYLAWLMDVFGLDSADEANARFDKRRTLLQVQFESPEQLRQWAEELFDFFENVNRQASIEAKRFSIDSDLGKPKPTKVRGVVSESSVRLYRRTWHELVESPWEELWHSSKQSAASDVISTAIEKEMDFESLPFDSKRGVTRFARSTSDWDKRAIARSMGLSNFEQSLQPSINRLNDVAATVSPADSAKKSAGDSGKVRIEIIEEGSNGFTIPMEWDSIQEALREVVSSLKPIAHIVGNGRVDRAKISVGPLKSDKFEISETTIDTVSTLFYNFLELQLKS